MCWKSTSVRSNGDLERPQSDGFFLFSRLNRVIFGLGEVPVGDESFTILSTTYLSKIKSS